MSFLAFFIFIHLGGKLEKMKFLGYVKPFVFGLAHLGCDMPPKGTTHKSFNGKLRVLDSIFPDLVPSQKTV